LDAEEHGRGHGRVVVAFGAKRREASLRVLGVDGAGRADVVTNVDERRFRNRGRTVVVDDRQQLEAGVSKLGKEIDALKVSLKSKPKLLALL
jgi:hypothetical protein